MNRLPPPRLSPDLLRAGLPACVELLRQRRAADIPAGYIEDYVTLDWMEWQGGSLKLTTLGQNICRQLAVRTA